MTILLMLRKVAGKLGCLTIANVCYPIVCLAFAQLLMHIPNISCTSKIGKVFCQPQLTLSFPSKPPEGDDLLVAVKELLRLLSYMAIDLGSNHKFPLDTDYDEVNLVNTFEPSNVFRVNFFGYCKDQPKVTGLKTYCVNNKNGLEPTSLIMRDMGIQFGILSLKNPRIMGDSFVYAYKLVLRTLADSSKSLGKDNNVIKTYLSKISSDSNPEVTRIQAQKAAIFANWLLLIQDFCLTVSWLNVIELILCIITVLLAMTVAPAISAGRQSRWIILNMLTAHIMRVIAIVVVVANGCGILSSTLWYVALRKAGSSLIKDAHVFDIKLGSGYYLTWVRLLCESVFLWYNFRHTKPLLNKRTEDREEIQLKNIEEDPLHIPSTSSETTV